MKSSIEALEGNTVKLSVEVDESEFDRDVDAAFRKIAREVRIPGFRAGKAPRRVLEAHVGLAAARGQALNDAIPSYLSRAVREHDVDLIAVADVKVTDGEETGPVSFEATCEVRPEITVAGYRGLRVELVNPELSDEEFAEAVESEMRRHGTLVDKEGTSQPGDYVIIDLEGTSDGKPVPGLNVDEWTYEIGRGWVAPGFDDQMTGVSKGDTLAFTLTPNGTQTPADFKVTVNKVQTLALPELTDEWVSSHVADHDSVEGWKTALRARLVETRLDTVRRTLVDRVTDALAGLVDIEAPPAMVDGDLNARVRNTLEQMRAQGIELDQWLQITGQDTASFVEGMRIQSEKAVKVDLALRAVATAESIETTDDDLEAEFQALAVRFNEKPAKVRASYERNDAVADLAAQIRTSKALDWMLHNVSYVDQNGRSLDTETVLGHSEDDHHHGETDTDTENTDMSEASE
ncbi:MAG: trigger factor [Actinomycetota bacterium]